MKMISCAFKKIFLKVQTLAEPLRYIYPPGKVSTFRNIFYESIRNGQNNSNDDENDKGICTH